MNCRNESGQSEIAMQALDWISLAEKRAKNKAKVKCLKFSLTWQQLDYHIS